MIRANRYLMSLLVFLMACSPNSESANEALSPSGTLTFIHLNDTYRIDAVEDGNAGGFGRVVTIIRGLKKQGNDVRILHGGDFLFPSLESQLWGGEQMVEALNFMDDIAPMYIVPGNHEFDRRTPDALVNAVRQSRFDWLGNNWRLLTGEDDVDQRLHEHFVIEFGDRKIGIFALTAHFDDGGNDRDYAPVDKNYLAIAEEAIKKLEAEGVDAIIGLTHLYLSTDKEIAGLKANHPRFLFIAGGHDHEPVHEVATKESAEIVKGASNARAVWQIDVRFPSDDATPEITTRMISIDSSIVKDADYQVLAMRWRKKLLAGFPFLTAKVGTAALRMDAREETIRSRESAWSNFIVDQMRSAFGEPAADFAFINSGTLRIDDYIAEDVTFEDIGRTFGFSSFLRHLVMSGSDFKTLMQVGYRGTGSQGYFPQISGFRVCVDRSRPEGDRIVQMQLPTDDGWSDIDPDKDYLVVAPDFLYRGGDGYDFSNAREVSRIGSELKYLVLDAVIRAQAAGQAIGKAVDPLNPRIAMLPEGKESCF
ncbi:MAG: 5'-nucleotidase C-terminal domain-containing protein [Gammaproteobacteria bacterium]|nr:5'-nucleotidase C-terminal domain-containing protein [Gammaproteobacteria bacterium]